MIRNIVFDIGKVLVEWDVMWAFEQLGFSAETAEAVADATVRTKDWNEFDRSARSDEEQLQRFIDRAPQYEQEIRLYWDHLELPIWQYDYVKPWMQELKREGYRIYILSNYPRRTYGVTQEALSFLEQADGALFSFEVQRIKPEPEIYQALLKRYHLKAEECIFLDDKEENIKGAESQGMQGILFTSYEDARRRIKEIAAKQRDDNK
jgi:putative hydrolase of the HAD superfamily